MLVLTRRSNQSIMIGDDIEVKILGLSGEKVRIGVSAPEDVAVFRDEVFDKLNAGMPTGSNGNGSAPREA